VSEIASVAAAEGHGLARRLGLEEWLPAASAEQHRIAIAYMVELFREAGLTLNPGHRFPTDELVNRLHPAPHHHRLLRCFLQHLEREGYLRQDGEEWKVLQAPPEGDADSLWREAWRRYPSFGADLILLARCGRRLGPVIRGEINPLEILFPDGPTTTLANIYRSSPNFRVVNRMMEAALREIVKGMPEGRILRILEVGAGTGGLTTHLLPLLDRQSASYVFTDISPSLLAKAERRFGDHSFMQWKPFDLDRDPSEQGFDPHTFDLILASDVLHACSDVRQALGRLRWLLGSRGLLALVEAERRNANLDVIFGLTEGWWRFEDRDLRPDHPLLDRNRWGQVLEDSGFTDVEPLPYLPGDIESAHIAMLARSTREDEARPHSPSSAASLAVPEEKSEPGAWLILRDRSGVGRKLGRLLTDAGQRCLEVEADEGERALEEDGLSIPPRRSEMTRFLREVTEQGETIRGVVHLWSLDVLSPEGDSPEALRRGEVLGCHSVLHLLQGLQEVGQLSGGPRFVLVTRGVQSTDSRRGPASISQAPLIGLGRVLLNEHPEIRLKMVDLEREPSSGEVLALFKELFTEDGEEEIALRRESRLMPRAGLRSPERVAPTELVHPEQVTPTDVSRTEPAQVEGAAGRESSRLSQLPAEGEEVPGFRLMASTTGAMDQLRWQETSGRRPGPGEVAVTVEAAGLNFRDVLKALAIYPAEADDYLLLGDECAGRIAEVGKDVTGFAIGDPVLAMGRGCFASRVVVPAAAVLHKPDALSFEEAATVPVAFLTAAYALETVGRLRKGESVLIQAGAGGVGMAAVQIAQRAGATVFASAGSPEKREILELMGVDHVLDSRSLSFADEVLRITEGRGIDIVLNSLAGKAIRAGLSCLAPFGRFLELGKRDIYQNTRVGLWAFRNNLSIHAIELGRLAVEEPGQLQSHLQDLAERFRDGSYHPLPHTPFGASAAVEAFRHMAQARHVGKVVLSMGDPHLKVERPARPTGAFRHDASYLITGGLRGFGLAVAEWLVEKGARHLVLIGRSGAVSQEAQEAVRRLEERGARVLAAKSDVTDPQNLRATLDQAGRTMPPVRGVFHCAMVMDDGLLLQLDAERFSRVMEPKVAGTWNLHRQTLDLDLEHFVLFSSLSSWVGTPGQGNYVAANSFLDAFAHYRRSLGLPALAVNWGRLDEVGYIARHPEIREMLTRRGFVGFNPTQAMVGLSAMLGSPQVQLGFFRLDWTASSEALRGIRLPRRVAALYGKLVEEKESEDEGGRIRKAIRQAGSEERCEIVTDYVRRQAARVLGAAATTLDPERPLGELGFDSLMGVELKNYIDSDLGMSLPTGALMENPTIHTVTAAILDMMEGRAPGATTVSRDESAESTSSS
jgi:NADPH:quinone reductase-like Zn-dependent oxidoreductase/SAM-dependent methyltransferase